MRTTKPEALRLADALAYCDASVASQAAAELRRQHAEIADLRAQLSAVPLMGAAGDAGWVSVDERLPEPGKPVLLDIGKKHPIRAMWAAKHTVEAHDEAAADWGEYDEATDALYCPEGWYEWNEHEEVHWCVTSTPVAWCALPAPLQR